MPVDESVKREPFFVDYMEIDPNGHIRIRFPHLEEDMTEKEEVVFKEWEVEVDDVVRPDDYMATVHYKGLAYLTIPRVGYKMRVVELLARPEQVLHLQDPLIVLEVIKTWQDVA